MGEGFVDVNGVRLWCEDRGDPDGEAVVLIMGATASAISWPEELLDALAADAHAIAVFTAPSRIEALGAVQSSTTA